MKIRCEYCGNVYQPSSFRPTCICCGAPAPINDIEYIEHRWIGMEAAGTVFGSLQEGGVIPIDYKYYVFQGGYDK